MIICISTAPRTGSMWLFNVTREILRSEGFKVVPDKVPQTHQEMVGYAENAADDEIAVIKTHYVADAPSPTFKIITSWREPKDVVRSYMEFVRVPFDKALACAQGLKEVAEHYENFPPEHCLKVEYSDIEKCPWEVLEDIYDFLGLDVDYDVVNWLVVKYSREKVKKLTEELDSDEKVVISPDNVRDFDVATGFQTGHVSNGEIELTAAQVERVKEFTVVRK